MIKTLFTRYVPYVASIAVLFAGIAIGQNLGLDRLGATTLGYVLFAMTWSVSVLAHAMSEAIDDYTIL